MIKFLYTVLSLLYLTVFFSIFIYFNLEGMESIFRNGVLIFFYYILVFIIFLLTFITMLLDLLIGGRYIRWWPRFTDYFPMGLTTAFLILILIIGIILFFFGNEINELITASPNRTRLDSQ